MGAQKISVGKPSSQGADLAMVPMTPTYGRGGASNRLGPIIKVYVVQDSDAAIFVLWRKCHGRYWARRTLM